jgi:murein DD-endopeptidase MepM/ murein hydrolase activator NlpD
VVAVHAGTITRVGYAYKNDKRLNSIDLKTNNGYRVGELYIKPGAGIKAGVRVTAGQVIGTAQDIRVRIGPGITPHIHVQIFRGSERINPETLIPVP